MARTSFETVDGGRDLYSTCQEVGESGERQGEENSECSGCREEDHLWMAVVDIGEGVHDLARVDVMIRA